MQGYKDELYHWGIKGMKWGVRRYQNKDGTLTAAGRKHYGDGNSGEDAEQVEYAPKRSGKKAEDYSDLYVELAIDPDKAAEFMNGVMGADVRKMVAENEAKAKAAEVSAAVAANNARALAVANPM